MTWQLTLKLQSLFGGRNSQSAAFPKNDKLLTELENENPQGSSQFSDSKNDNMAHSSTQYGIGSTIAKPRNDILVGQGGTEVSRQNEDAFRLEQFEDGTVLAAVSDGAGGEGIYCGEWARTLLRNLHSEPIRTNEELNRWLKSFWESFYVEYSAHSKSNPTVHRKFFIEGSLATLSAVWIVPTSGKFFCYGVFCGDSPIFLLRDGESDPALEMLFPDSVGALNQNPYLINWRSEIESEAVVFLNRFELKRGDVIVLTSDGIGRFLALKELFKYSSPDVMTTIVSEDRQSLLQEHGKLAAFAKTHAENPSINASEVISEIIAAMWLENGFQHYVKKQLELGLIENDDCTIVVTKIS